MSKGIVWIVIDEILSPLEIGERGEEREVLDGFDPFQVFEAERPA